MAQSGHQTRAIAFFHLTLGRGLRITDDRFIRVGGIVFLSARSDILRFTPISQACCWRCGVEAHLYLSGETTVSRRRDGCVTAERQQFLGGETVVSRRRDSSFSAERQPHRQSSNKFDSALAALRIIKLRFMMARSLGND